MDPFTMVVAIVALSLAAGTVHKYLDVRARTGGSADKNLLRAVEELRAEFAALKQHETEAVLSFDSTLQSLDTRLKHLEQRSLAQGAAERTSLGPVRTPSVEEPAQITVKSGDT